MAGMISGFITTPVDVMKSRMMLSTLTAPEKTLRDWFRETLHKEGLRGFFRGGLVRTFYLGFNEFIYYGAYFWFLKLTGADGNFIRIRS